MHASHFLSLRSLAFTRHAVAVPKTRFLSSTTARHVENRIYQPIRSVPELDNLILLSSSNRIPLLTFWTASWCPSCRAVLPIVRAAIEEEKLGEAEGGVSFAEVEYDAPDAADLGMRYMITSIPTLLAFSRGEAQIMTKVNKLEQLKDKKFLKEWIQTEARRGGQGSAGSPSLFSTSFGKGA